MDCVVIVAGPQVSLHCSNGDERDMDHGPAGRHTRSCNAALSIRMIRFHDFFIIAHDDPSGEDCCFTPK
jgi:hypothetical protein